MLFLFKETCLGLEQYFMRYKTALIEDKVISKDQKIEENNRFITL